MNDIQTTAESYRHYAQKKSNAHYRMCERAKTLNNRLGVPVTIVTAIVGTAIFVSLSSEQQIVWVQISAGLLSLGAAVLSALHTFFNFSQVANQHKEAAGEFEAVRHELDVFLLASAHTDAVDAAAAAIEELRLLGQKLDEISKRAPSIPDKVYDSTRTRVAEKPILTPGKADNP